MHETDTRDLGKEYRVLLVEDEEGVRTSLAEVLRDNGYRVHLATDGPTALALAEGETSPFDVLITDVVLPRMSGQELAERLREKNPQLCVVYISGRLQNGPSGARGDEECSVYLEKPFRPTLLLSTLRELLGSRCRV